jgi:3',5'-cyclic-AMP phosphodiesterase
MRRFLLIHISDLHVKDASTPGSSLQALQSAVMTQITRLRIRTECSVYLFITGDLVSSPTRDAIKAATEFVNGLERALPLAHPALIVPGNHDVKTLGTFNRNTEPFFSAFPASKGVWHKSFPGDGLQIIGVDSNGNASFARGSLEQGSYDGLLQSANELARAILSTERAKMGGADFRILALHHHPLPIAEGEGFKELGFIPDEGFMYLQSPATFLCAAMSFGCQVILHGHRHVSGVARYSVPTSSAFSQNVLTEGEAWSTVYVVSCPSSTGVHCDAGFNILEFDEGDPNSYHQELKLYRFTRPRNAGDFRALDIRGSSNCPALIISHTQIGGTHQDSHRDETETKSLRRQLQAASCSNDPPSRPQHRRSLPGHEAGRVGRQTLAGAVRCRAT